MRCARLWTLEELFIKGRPYKASQGTSMYSARVGQRDISISLQAKWMGLRVATQGLAFVSLFGFAVYSGKFLRSDSALRKAASSATMQTVQHKM